MISKLKILVKTVAYRLVHIFVFPRKSLQPNTLLLIRLDAIGDYILFRNFIEILKKSRKYEDYRITLVGNIIWKDLAENLDKRFINKFIWIDRKKFTKDIIYRYKKLREITCQGYELIINPRYSREYFFDDMIVNLVNAKEKIGSVGDYSNIKKWQKNISDKFYTTLFPANRKIMFEFYRNKEFFESLLAEKLNIKRTFMNLQGVKISMQLPRQYVVLVLGAGADFRRWPVKNYLEVAKYLKKKYGCDIVFCGGSNDMEDSKKIERFWSGKVWNLVGKTSLLELVFIISQSKLVISNETCAPHIAAALDVPTVVISNGNHFGRFTPYPKEISDKYKVVCHPEIEKDLDNYKKLANNYGYGSNLDIKDITIESVIKKVENLRFFTRLVN